MTRKETIQVLALLHSAFPNTRIDAEATVNLWYSLYCNEDFETVKRATELIIRTNSYFPNHKDFGKALFACKSEEKKTPRISSLSEDSVNKKIQTICDWWANGEMDY